MEIYYVIEEEPKEPTDPDIYWWGTEEPNRTQFEKILKKIKNGKIAYGWTNCADYEVAKIENGEIKEHHRCF